MSTFTINRIVLIARLTKDPELRSLPSGKGVCQFRVACNVSRRDTDGEYHDMPNYFDVSAFGATAENVSRYMRKGSRIAIDGRLQWREWETSEQQKRDAVSIAADTIMFLDGSGKRPEIDQPQDGEPGDSFGADETYAEAAGELVGVGASAGDDDLIF